MKNYLSLKNLSYLLLFIVLNASYFIFFKTNNDRRIKSLVEFSISQGMVQSGLHFFDQNLKESDICSITIFYGNTKLQDHKICQSLSYRVNLRIDEYYNVQYEFGILYLILELILLNFLLFLLITIVHLISKRNDQAIVVNEYQDLIKSMGMERFDSTSQGRRNLKAEILRQNFKSKRLDSFIDEICSSLEILNSEDFSEEFMALKNQAKDNIISKSQLLYENYKNESIKIVEIHHYLRENSLLYRSKSKQYESNLFTKLENDFLLRILKGLEFHYGSVGNIELNHDENRVFLNIIFSEKEDAMMFSKDLNIIDTPQQIKLIENKIVISLNLLELELNSINDYHKYEYIYSLNDEIPYSLLLSSEKIALLDKDQYYEVIY